MEALLDSCLAHLDTRPWDEMDLTGKLTAITLLGLALAHLGPLARSRKAILPEIEVCGGTAATNFNSVLDNVAAAIARQLVVEAQREGAP